MVRMSQKKNMIEIGERNVDDVKLISVTPEAEKTILFIARVSSNQDNTSTGLINYLIKHGHWSPFEMAHMVIEMNTSCAISQQIVRHTSFRFQEFSQRYSSPDGAITYEGRKPAEKNRQSSTDELDEQVAGWWENAQDCIHEYVFEVYNDAIKRGIAKECARMILPLSTKTKIYMAGSIRSWIHYLGEQSGGRCNDDVQKEHRDLAWQAREIFCQEFPTISLALGWRFE